MSTSTPAAIQTWIIIGAGFTGARLAQVLHRAGARVIVTRRKLSDDAVATYLRALNISPTASAYFGLGTLYFFMGKRKEAIEMFERAVALRPRDARAWGNLEAELGRQSVRGDHGLEHDLAGRWLVRVISAADAEERNQREREPHGRWL